MDKISKKNKIILLVVLIILLVGIFVVAYAFFGSFTQNIENKLNVNIVIDESYNSTFISDATNIYLEVPTRNMSQYSVGTESADYALLNATLTSGSDDLRITCTYDIYFEYDQSSNVYGIAPTPVTTGVGDSMELGFRIWPNDDYPFAITGTSDYFDFNKNFNYDTSDGWIAASGSSGAKRLIVEGAQISDASTTGTTQSWMAGFDFINLDLDQNALAGKSFSGYIYIDNVDCSENAVNISRNKILADNGGKAAIEAKGAPNFNISASNNPGMYLSNDDDGVSYYYRGPVDNNWIKFGKEDGEDIYWRIVRIDGNGNFRLIYAGLDAPTSESAIYGSSNDYITTQTYPSGLVKYNSLSDRPEYVGMFYKEELYRCSPQYGGNSCSMAYFLGIVLEWLAKTDIQEIIDWNEGVTGFCQDRTSYTDLTKNNRVIDYTNDEIVYTDLTNNQNNNNISITSTQYFNGYFRVSDNLPSLNCESIYDLVNVFVGLLNVDEALMSGVSENSSNLDSYLVDGSNAYWTMTPADFTSSNGATVFVVGDDGILDMHNVSYENYVRPIIIVNPETIGTLDGSGTWDDPYVFSQE